MGVIPGYGIFNFNPDFLPSTIVVMTLNIWSFECVAEVCSVISMNPIVGMLCLIGAWYTAFLYSVLFLQPSFIIWPFRAFSWIFPLQHTVNAIVYLEYHD